MLNQITSEEACKRVLNLNDKINHMFLVNSRYARQASGTFRISAPSDCYFRPLTRGWGQRTCRKVALPVPAKISLVFLLHISSAKMSGDSEGFGIFSLMRAVYFVGNKTISKLPVSFGNLALLAHVFYLLQ